MLIPILKKVLRRPIQAPVYPKRKRKRKDIDYPESDVLALFRDYLRIKQG